MDLHREIMTYPVHMDKNGRITLEEARRSGLLTRIHSRRSSGKKRRVDFSEAIRRGWIEPKGDCRQTCSRRRNTAEGTPQRILYETLIESASGVTIEWEKKGLIPGRRFVVDIYLPESRICIEQDGFGYHRSLQAFKKDRERQNQFMLAGYRVLRFYSEEVFNTTKRLRLVHRIMAMHELWADVLRQYPELANTETFEKLLGESK